MKIVRIYGDIYIYIYQACNNQPKKVLFGTRSQTVTILSVIIMSRTNFRVNLQSIVCLNAKKLCAQSMSHIGSLNDSNRIRIHNNLDRK